MLNADGSPISIIPWQRALALVLNDKLVQLDFYAECKVRDGRGIAYPVPAVVMLRKYVHRPHHTVPFSRRNILIRDSLTCQYCGRVCEPKELTLDHVIPRSRWTGQGGPTVWTNVVAACEPCNKRKGDRLCEQAGMFPMQSPVKPKHGDLFIGLSPWREKIPQEWGPFLKPLVMLDRK